MRVTSYVSGLVEAFQLVRKEMQLLGIFDPKWVAVDGAVAGRKGKKRGNFY